MTAAPAAVADDDRLVAMVPVVVRLAWPAVLASLVQTLVFLADRIMLGRYDQAALGSMQVQGPVLWSVFSVFFAGLVGTVTLVSTSVGARVVARRAGRIAMGGAVVLGAVVGIGITAGAGPIAAFFGPSDPTLVALSRQYLRVAGVGMFGLFVASTAATVLQAAGDTRTPLAVGLVANSANVAINAALIFGVATPWGTLPALGVLGAAMGTSTAFLLEAVLLVRHLGWRAGPLSLAREPLAPDPDANRRIVRRMVDLAGPAVLDRLAVHVGFLEFVRVIGRLGPTAMAANQALVTLESVCFLTADGFAVAAATVMGQHLGAGRPSGAARGTAVTVAMACATLSIFGLALWAAGPVLLTVFVPRGEPPEPLVGTAAVCLPILALAQPVMALAVVLAQALRGAGDTRAPLAAAVAGSLVVRVGAAHGLALALGLGLAGIWWASTADWAVRSLVLVAVFLRGRWRRGPHDGRRPSAATAGRAVPAPVSRRDPRTD